MGVNGRGHNPLPPMANKIGDKVKTECGIGEIKPMEVNGRHLYRIVGEGFAQMLLKESDIQKYEKVEG